jgi:GH15 family glucan-1,4-alpha-glucosidase
MDLYHRSIEVILQNQHSSGAYIASPAFPNYHYCWLRDGSFIAHAMDRVGEYQSSEAFFRWVDRAINKYSYKVDKLEDQIKNAPFTGERSILHTRYTLDGEEESSDSTWGNFQIDGYGTWLWALAAHVQMTKNYALLSEFSTSINTTIRYLRAAWQLPNYDCWEEHPEFLHPYSLSAVYGGLNAVAALISSGHLKECTFPVEAYAREVKDFLSRAAISDQRIVKHVWPASQKQAARPVKKSGVDASLLGFAIPYAVFPLDDKVIVETMDAIEKELHRPNGGVYRYREDVYYGGGEWILLTAWLGWYYAKNNEPQRAQRLLAWIEDCADARGNLPEQVNNHLLAPSEYQSWVERWGPVATPLLWSHAMYLILSEELKQPTNSK